ncbi:ankyrin repeat domain-containing protein 13C-B, partial [Tanacetum coccineum]
QPLDEFITPPSSPTATDQNLQATTSSSPSYLQATTSSSSSWFQWIKAPYQHASTSTPCTETVQDPFVIPADYTWITAEEKKKRMQEKSKSKKSRNDTL